MNYRGRSSATTTPIGQDSELSWYDWTLDDRRKNFLEFAQRVNRYRKQHPNFHRYAFYHNDAEAIHPDKNIVWFRADGQAHGGHRLGRSAGGCARSACFSTGWRRQIRDSEGKCAHWTRTFLLLLNAHHEPVTFRISYQLFSYRLEGGIRHGRVRTWPWSRKS